MTTPEDQTLYNIYCDESCHLPNDGQPVMVLGAVWCPQDQARRLGAELRALKARHDARGELKWSKTSQARLPFYLGSFEIRVGYATCGLRREKSSLPAIRKMTVRMVSSRV